MTVIDRIDIDLDLDLDLDYTECLSRGGHRGCVEWGSVTEERGPAGLRLTIEAIG